MLGPDPAPTTSRGGLSRLPSLSRQCYNPLEGLSVYGPSHEGSIPSQSSPLGEQDRVPGAAGSSGLPPRRDAPEHPSGTGRCGTPSTHGDYIAFIPRGSDVELGVQKQPGSPRPGQTAGRDLRCHQLSGIPSRGDVSSSGYLCAHWAAGGCRAFAVIYVN